MTINQNNKFKNNRTFKNIIYKNEMSRFEGDMWGLRVVGPTNQAFNGDTHSRAVHAGIFNRITRKERFSLISFYLFALFGWKCHKTPKLWLILKKPYLSFFGIKTISSLFLYFTTVSNKWFYSFSFSLFFFF